MDDQTKKPSSTPACSGSFGTSLPDADRYEEDVVVEEPLEPDAGAGDEDGVVVVVAAGATDSFFSSVFFDVVSPPAPEGGLSLSE